MAKVTTPIFRFRPFSEQQLKVLTWWLPCSPYHDWDGIIADGSIRSGKTVSMALSYIMWAMATFDGQTFGLCGKTIASFRRNVLAPLKQMLPSRGYMAVEHRTDSLLTIAANGKHNDFYIFGGHDESSQDLIQGITLAGCLFDEVALMPESFVNQATARCSVTGGKLWFNCNPSAPLHWFKVGWIDRAASRLTQEEEWQLQEQQIATKRLLYLHFTMRDNLSLDNSVKERYEAMYSGVFYARYILGLWALAEGLVYPCWDDQYIIRGDVRPSPSATYYISIDYGTLNPFAAGLWMVTETCAIRVAEYYYDGRAKTSRTDEEHYAAVKRLADGYPIRHILVDPSAASFLECIRRHGEFTGRKAKNDVASGIQRTSVLIQSGKILIHESCKGWLSEIKQYRWDDKRQSDAVRKEHDHAMDDTRYLVNTVLRRTLLREVGDDSALDRI